MNLPPVGVDIVYSELSYQAFIPYTSHVKFKANEIVPKNYV